MCVIFCYVNSNPDLVGYKLILASNRDEFFARETLAVGQWEKAKHVYGGVDMEPGREGGSWLAVGGINDVFKVGALLNLTGEPKPKNAAGRGMIVSDYVASNDSTIEDYNQNLVADCIKYSAFNFLSIQIHKNSSKAAQIMLCSNVPPGLEIFKEGECYGFGNSLPSAPFEKVQEGQRKFQEIVYKLRVNNQSQEQSCSLKREELIKECINLLKCKQKFWPDKELKRRAPNWGEHLSAIKVYIPEALYGSRTHSVILIDEYNKMYFYEETLEGDDPTGKWSCKMIEKQFFTESCL